MHTWIRRVCYVLLFGLVIEGALTFPLLAVWYGFPTLSPTEVCSELHRVMYADGHYACRQPYPDGNPPLWGTSEAEDQTTARDTWGVQPVPGYPRVDFRELVERHEACEAWREGELADPDGERPPDDYCNWLTP